VIDDTEENFEANYSEQPSNQINQYFDGKNVPKKDIKSNEFDELYEKYIVDLSVPKDN
jgi:hypothetical protein